MRSQQVILPVTTRTEVGKGAARRLRAQGMIPAVLYGRGMESLSVSVAASQFARALLETGWYSTLLRLTIEGGEVAERDPAVMISEVQRDPVRRSLLSIDFHRVSMHENLRTQIPVVHVNQSPGVKRGGILEHIMHEVLVECLPRDIPDHFEADISGMDIGDTLRVRDLVAPPGVQIQSPPDETVIVIAPPVKLEEEAAPAAAEGAAVEEIEEPGLVGERESEE